jgi:hypothetical protein
MDPLRFPDLVLSLLLSFTNVAIAKLVCKRFHIIVSRDHQNLEFTQICTILHKKYTYNGIIELCFKQNKYDLAKKAIDMYPLSIVNRHGTRNKLLLYIIRMSLYDKPWALSRYDKYYPHGDSRDALIINFLTFYDLVLFPYESTKMIYHDRPDLVNKHIINGDYRSFKAKCESFDILYLIVTIHQIVIGKSGKILKEFLDCIQKIHITNRFKHVYRIIFQYGSFEQVKILLDRCEAMPNGSIRANNTTIISLQDILSYISLNTQEIIDYANTYPVIGHKLTYISSTYKSLLQDLNDHLFPGHSETFIVVWHKLDCMIRTDSNIEAFIEMQGHIYSDMERPNVMDDLQKMAFICSDLASFKRFYDSETIRTNLYPHPFDSMNNPERSWPGDFEIWEFAKYLNEKIDNLCDDIEEEWLFFVNTSNIYISS